MRAWKQSVEMYAKAINRNPNQTRSNITMRTPGGQSRNDRYGSGFKSSGVGDMLNSMLKG